MYQNYPVTCVEVNASRWQFSVKTEMEVELFCFCFFCTLPVLLHRNGANYHVAYHRESIELNFLVYFSTEYRTSFKVCV